MVYVRNRNNRKDYLCLLSTDLSLEENEIIRLYGKRWDIEVFFKVCKSYLKLSRECHSLSYDAMTAHTAVVFTRYMMLSLESRESNDIRSLGELFVYISDEMADITWLQALQMLLQLFRSTLSETAELTEEKINKLVDNFLDTLPSLLKSLLCAAQKQRICNRILPSIEFSRCIAIFYVRSLSFKSIIFVNGNTTFKNINNW